MKMILNGNGKSGMVKPKVIDLDIEPCPTIMADGVGGGLPTRMAILDRGRRRGAVELRSARFCHAGVRSASVR